MRMMLLRSSDGQDFSVPVIPPARLSDKEAEQLANQAIEEARAARPGEWEFEDLRPRLKEKGFLLPRRIVLGPFWD